MWSCQATRPLALMPHAAHAILARRGARVAAAAAACVAGVLVVMAWAASGYRRGDRHHGWNHSACQAVLSSATPQAPLSRRALVDTVIVSGISGLGNNLFQVAAAVYYAETYGAHIVLDAGSAILCWGTASYTNRDKARRSLRGRPLSYLDTLFASPRLCWQGSQRTQNASILDNPAWPAPITRVHADYTADRFVPPSSLAHNTSATILHLTGFHQHRDLFTQALPALPTYLNLDAGFHTRALLKTKYGLRRGQHHAIMLGVRRGADFAHMTKVGMTAYERGLRAVFETRARHATPWTLVVLADTDDVSDMKLAERASAIAADVSAGHSVRTVVIAEDDITQLHAGLSCDHFILSESTFHYWIAVLRSVIPPRRPGVQVVVFEDTDLTNRQLALDGWTRLPYK